MAEAPLPRPAGDFTEDELRALAEDAPRRHRATAERLSRSPAFRETLRRLSREAKERRGAGREGEP